MSSDDITTIAPIAHGPGEGEATWFLGFLVTTKATGKETGGRVTVMENRGPRGAGSPLHVHRRTDEWFYVLEGEVTFWVGGETFVAPAGAFVYGPRDVPHTFVVSSDEANFLLVTQPAGFEDFVAAVGDPALRLEIPPPATEPPDVAALSAVAATFGIDIVGPPGIPA